MRWSVWMLLSIPNDTAPSQAYIESTVRNERSAIAVA